MKYARMVALGSSFAAGPGIEPVEDRGAGRSARNYPHLVAEALGAQLVDATVSGATTATILDVAQRVAVRRFAPQIESVTAGTDLVTITAGGNDLDYLSGVISTALLQQLWRRRATRHAARAIRARRPLAAVTTAQEEATALGLTHIVETVRNRAPGARIVVVDYLSIFGEDSLPRDARPFRAGEVAHFRTVASALSRAIQTAANRTGADLVPESAFGRDHGIGSSQPWVNGLQPVRRLGSSFHPNAAGMAAVADAVIQKVHHPPRTEDWERTASL